MSAVNVMLGQNLVPVEIVGVTLHTEVPTEENVLRSLSRLGRRLPDPDRPSLESLAQSLSTLLREAGVRMPGIGERHWAVQLKEIGGPGTLSFETGAAEAEALALFRQHVQLPRPTSHDLMLSLLRADGSTLEQVTITRHQADIYYASIRIRTQDGRDLEVDAHPSDALNLAIRADVPIFVASQVM